MKIHARWVFKLTILAFNLKRELHDVQLNISLYQAYIFTKTGKEYKFTILHLHDMQISVLVIA